MSSPKGFPSQVKDIRVGAQHATVEPVGVSQFGLTVSALMFNFVVGTDATETNSNVLNNLFRIKATGHSVLKGDIIRFTSGTFNGREIKVASIFDADNFDLVEELASAPVNGTTFQVLRAKAPVINSDGTLFTSSSGDISFQRNGSSQIVTEDTVTPANNRALPVKLTDVTGDLNITAQNLNVQSTHTGANPDSMQIGDGTDLMAVNADGSINVVGTFTEVATAADGAAGLPALTKVVSGFDGANVQALKTDASGELQIDVLSQPARSHSADSIRIGDGTDLVSVTAANQLEVAVTASLPSGTNNIGDVDVLSQPARSHSTDSIRIGDGTDLVNVTASNQLEVAVTAALPSGTNNIGDVDVLSQPARSHSTDSIRIGDGTDLLLITGSGEALVSLTTALPAGTNNIGDVDVLSQPARSHTTDSVRIGDGTDLLLVTAAGEALVSLTTALPSGTNNIGDVDVLSVVPGTSATSLGKAEDDAHTSGDTGVMSLAVRNDAGSALAGSDGDYIPLSTDSVGNLRTVERALTVVDFFDTPLLDASSTNIPGSASNSLQVVASSASAIRKIQVFDTTGEFFGIFTGAVATPTLVAVVGPGSNETVDVSIASGTIISLRSLTTTAISSGNVTMNFLG